MRKMIIIALVVIFSFSGCYRDKSLGQSGLYDVAQIVETAIPYGYTWNAAFDEVELLETDQYGRKLYHYRSFQKNEFILICQKTESPLAYYYEDACYDLHTAQITGFTNTEIEDLKAMNDWDQPLDTSKMRSVDYVDPIEDIHNRANTEKVIKETLGRETDNYDISLDGLETDINGDQIIFVVVSDTANPNQNDELYLVLYKYDETDPRTVASRQLDIGTDYRTSIIAFKEACKTGDGTLSLPSQNDIS